MKRHIYLTAAVAAALLAACGQNGDTVTPASEIAAQPQPMREAEQPAKAKPVPAPDDQKGAELLQAAGVQLGFEHSVLYDILDTSKSGTPRHRVLYEVRGMPFDQAVAALGESLVALGYRKASDKDTGGRIDQVFQADGKPTYYLLMQPAGMGPKLQDPAATGSIHVMWNIR